MGERFVWSDELSVGNEAIDQQHKRLFQMGNQLEAAEEHDSPKYMMMLYEHMREHFDTEEEHMQAIAYPALKEHHALHRQLEGDLNFITRHYFTARRYQYCERITI